jgi:hypothetical protein
MSNATESKPKGSVGEGRISVAILLGLVALRIYGVLKLQDPADYGCPYAPSAVWAVSSFFFTLLGGGIGALYEAYLVAIGNLWEVDTNKFIQSTTAGSPGYIFSGGLIFDTFMVLGADNAKLLNNITFFLVIFCPLVAPGLFFGKKLAGAILGGLVLTSLIVVSIFGCAYGGTKATIFLAGSKLLLFVAYYVTPPGKSLQNNIVFHILRTLCVSFVLVSFEYARAESPCFAQEAESQISTFVLPTMAGSVLLEWMRNASTAFKAVDAAKKVA